MEQKSIINRSKFEVQKRVPFGINFFSILMGFGRQVRREHGGMLAPKWHQTFILPGQSHKAKSAYKTNIISMILGVRGLQVGAKIDQKSIKI